MGQTSIVFRSKQGLYRFISDCKELFRAPRQHEAIGVNVSSHFYLFLILELEQTLNTIARS